MRNFTLALACLAFVGHGRREQTRIERLQGDLQRRVEISSPSKTFSLLILALSPSAGWQVGLGPKSAFRAAIGSPATLRPHVLMRQHDKPGTLIGHDDAAQYDSGLEVKSQMSAVDNERGGMIDGARIGPPPDLASMLLNNRIVYLGLAITEDVSKLIISQLLWLQSESADKPITMYINSPGTTLEDGRPVGYETGAFAIYDTMQYVTPPIHTVCIGKAYGLSAMLLAAGEKGQRRSLPYGTVMLHQPRGQQAQGQASDIAIAAKEVLANRQMALDIMAELTGQSLSKLTEDTNRCLYMNAESAIEYGIVDKVMNKKEAEKAKSLTSALS